MSESEIKEICKSEVRNIIRGKLETESDVQRFLANSSYQFVWNAVEEICPDNMMEIIKNKIPEIVNELSAFSVFRKKDAWDRDESKGWVLLQSALSESQPLIVERVHELIREIDIYTIKDILIEQIDNVIDNLKTSIN